MFSQQHARNNGETFFHFSHGASRKARDGATRPEATVLLKRANADSTASRPGFLFNVASTQHEHDGNMPHPTPPLPST